MRGYFKEVVLFSMSLRFSLLIIDDGTRQKKIFLFSFFGKSFFFIRCDYENHKNTPLPSISGDAIEASLGGAGVTGT